MFISVGLLFLLLMNQNLLRKIENWKNNILNGSLAKMMGQERKTSKGSTKIINVFTRPQLLCGLLVIMLLPPGLQPMSM